MKSSLEDDGVVRDVKEQWQCGSEGQGDREESHPEPTIQINASEIESQGTQQVEKMDGTARDVYDQPKQNIINNSEFLDYLQDTIPVSSRTNKVQGDFRGIGKHTH